MNDRRHGWLRRRVGRYIASHIAIAIPSVDDRIADALFRAAEIERTLLADPEGLLLLHTGDSDTVGCCEHELLHGAAKLEVEARAAGLATTLHVLGNHDLWPGDLPIVRRLRRRARPHPCVAHLGEACVVSGFHTASRSEAARVFAIGRFGVRGIQTQIAGLRQLTRAAAGIAATHHPVRRRRGQGLWMLPSLNWALRIVGADVIFSGHTHRVHPKRSAAKLRRRVKPIQLVSPSPTVMSRLDRRVRDVESELSYAFPVYRLIGAADGTIELRRVLWQLRARGTAAGRQLHPLEQGHSELASDAFEPVHEAVIARWRAGRVGRLTGCTAVG